MVEDRRHSTTELGSLFRGAELAIDPWCKHRGYICICVCICLPTSDYLY